MGSVKDLEILKKPTESEVGLGRFIFSDRYSVFDWGEMPDHIPNKGAALCIMGSVCFEGIEKMGIKTHYQGLVGSDGKAHRLEELEEPSNIMEVGIVNVVRPKFEDGVYDYSNYRSDLANLLIPLEIIYRNSLPEGSSVFKRLERGDTTYGELGLDKMPTPGDKLEEPIFDVSTKLEERDRYISWKEAQEISCMNESEVDGVKDVLKKVNDLITETGKKAGLFNEDGKIELAYDPNRELMLVDILGTLDECRFTYDGMSVSKEVARKYYKTTGWYRDVEMAKNEADEKKVREWKELCRTQPEKLPEELKTIVGQMYTSTANVFLGRNIFESPKLEEVVKAYKDFIQ
ncbi:phosphoribosylaminoimidazolesuccinocarboxamide synthase [Candidatus Undinarchaeota archaeon]